MLSLLLFSVLTLLEVGIAKKYFIAMTELNLKELKLCEPLIETKVIIIPPGNNNRIELTFQMVNNGGQTLFFAGMTQPDEKNLFEVDLEEGAEYKLVVPSNAYSPREEKGTLKIEDAVLEVKIGRASFSVDECSFFGDPGCPVKTWLYPSFSDTKKYLSISYKKTPECPLSSLMVMGDLFTDFTLKNVFDKPRDQSIVIPINADTSIVFVNNKLNVLGRLHIPFSNNQPFKVENAVPQCNLVVELSSERVSNPSQLRTEYHGTIFLQRGASYKAQYSIWLCVKATEDSKTCDEGEAIMRIPTNDKATVFSLRLFPSFSDQSIVDIIVSENKDISIVKGDAKYVQHKFRLRKDEVQNEYICANHVCLNLFPKFAYNIKFSSSRKVEVSLQNLKMFSPYCVPKASALPGQPCVVPEEKIIDKNMIIYHTTANRWMSTSLYCDEFSIPVNFDIMATEKTQLAPNEVFGIDKTGPEITYSVKTLRN